MQSFLEQFEEALPWLTRTGFKDPKAAHRNVVALAERGVPLDLMNDLRDELGKHLPGSADPDMALNNFERMISHARSPLSMVTFLLRKPHSLSGLLQMFAASQYFSELIVNTPEYFDFLWERGAGTFDVESLREEILSEIGSLKNEEEAALRTIRRYRQRELLRIGYQDIVCGQPLDQVTRSISNLADCLVDVALRVGIQKQASRNGNPRTSNGDAASIVVLGMGKLGGQELNYSSDIDLILIYDQDGYTDGEKRITNSEFYANVVRKLVRLLSASTQWGQAYRVDLRLRPHGGRSALCMTLPKTLAYYDQHGRTWERQALVKARAIAGDLRLGAEFLRSIEPFVYRRYLTYVEINEIKAIKRQIEAKTRESDADATDLKTGRGGIRDIEFVTQFLQLVNGRALPEIRERNTLRALRKLATAGCIHRTEHMALETAYRFQRKAEHRLQFMFDLQTHRLPDRPAELEKLAVRMGFAPASGKSAGDQFKAQLEGYGAQNRRILKRLMLDLFSEEESDGRIGKLEADLLLNPKPEQSAIRAVLGKYRFADPLAAYKNLQALAREDVAFLSSVRCRHFLASIAADLLRTIAEAPDPDMALVNLEKVTASLGAKGVLWESCSVNPQLLRIYVHICSWSQFLSEILINNPGMIDELLDSLVYNRPPALDEQRRSLRRLLKGAVEIEPILHAFKNTSLLVIGVHDILHKRKLRRTLRELSDLAEVIITAITDVHYEQMLKLHGVPTTAAADRAGYALVGLGKFGGRELSYHSDLDMILVYEAEGKTVADTHGASRGTTSNSHFYTELAQHVIRTAGRLGPLGRLYPVDLRLRPTGRSGSLVVSFEKFQQYYLEGQAALWERMAMTRARIVGGSRELRPKLETIMRQAIVERPWDADMVNEIHDMRFRLEESRGPGDLKRGPGGIVDIEFAVQIMQIKYGRQHPEIVHPSIWQALREIRKAGLWPPSRARAFFRGYTFLRKVQNRLRIVHNVSRDDLPEDLSDLAKLAYRLDYEGAEAGQKLLSRIHKVTESNRNNYLESLEDER